MQVVFLKLFFRHFRYIAIWVFIWEICQEYSNIVQELVIFGEYYNNGNFKVMC
jgi:hypothetical protein